MKVYPESKRVLLAACGDTKVATRAINQAILHRRVIKLGGVNFSTMHLLWKNDPTI
jgi:hypothetical protein